MQFLKLPPSLLLLVAAQVSARQDEPSHPTAVRKMSPDSDEKIFPHYLAFAPGFASSDEALAEGLQSVAARGALSETEAQLLAANSSALLPFRPPYATHSDDSTDAGRELFRRAAQALAILQKRQWGCPAGTASCVGIGYPFSCCHTGETCYKISDTGLGPVGCCAAGSNCGGTISRCGAGDLACPSELGGGCCIQGYVCQGVGCVLSAPSSPPPPPPTTSTTTSRSTPTSSSTTSPPTQTTPTSSPPPSTTSGVAPVKPTLTSGTTLPPDSGYCPTGFYACLASAGGGCCQTGRDCATTNCPPVASTTIVSDGRTVVVPASPTPPDSGAKTCAGGWFLCGASAGPVAGCCPSGYECGTASCSVNGPGGTGSVQKEFPSGGGRVREMVGRVGFLIPLFVVGFWSSHYGIG